MGDMDEWELVGMLKEVCEASEALNQARIRCKYRGPWLEHVHEAIYYADSVASDLRDALNALKEAEQAGKAERD